MAILTTRLQRNMLVTEQRNGTAKRRTKTETNQKEMKRNAFVAG